MEQHNQCCYYYYDCDEQGNFCPICKNELNKCSCIIKNIKVACKAHIHCLDCEICENIATHCLNCKSELTICICGKNYCDLVCVDHINGFKCCQNITFTIYCSDCCLLKSEECECKSSNLCCKECVTIKFNDDCSNCKKNNITIYKCETCHAFNCRDCLMDDGWDERMRDHVFCCYKCYQRAARAEFYVQDHK
jgi:hypothetical protein